MGRQSGEKAKIFLAELQNKDITSSRICPFISVEKTRLPLFNPF
jgi:hypothetical protein